MTESLQWTDQKPTEPGWYWYNGKSCYFPYYGVGIIDIRRYGSGDLGIGVCGYRIPDGVLWAGPILVPTENTPAQTWRDQPPLL